MIFCVEDDENIRNLILYTLNASNYQCIGFSCGDELFNELNNLNTNLPELIILDIMLPGIDGLTILNKLKECEKTKNIPVILATAKGTEYDKVKGLDLGADDYLVKPFGMMEMIARVKAVLRRSNIQDDKTLISNGLISLDEESHVAYLNNKVLDLTLKEYDLLSLFLHNLNRAFTRDQLLIKVWGTEFIGESRTIDVHVGTLRNKLSNEGNLIETVRGVGYRMVKAK